MSESSEFSRAHELLKSNLKLYGGEDLADSQGKLKLNDEQIQHLYNRIPLYELKDIEDTKKQCLNEGFRSIGAPFSALTVGSLYMARKWLPTKYRFGPKGYVISALSSFTVAGFCGAHAKSKERVTPKVAHLWQKYGDDESTANYAALSKGNRGGAEATNLVPKNMPMPVISGEIEAFSGLDSQGELRLTKAQFDRLLSKLSPEDKRDFEDARKRVERKVWITRSIPLVAVTLVPLIAGMEKLPGYFGLTRWPLFASTLIASYVISKIHVSTVNERLHPMVLQLWHKYGGAESTTNYESLSKGNRGGAETTGLIPENKSISVDSEKRASVDDTNSQRVIYTADTFARHSDSLISGTPSGAHRVRL